MRIRLVRLVAALGLISTIIAAFTVPRHSAVAASAGVVTFVSDTGGLNDNGFNHLGWLGTQAGSQESRLGRQTDRDLKPFRLCQEFDDRRPAI